MWLNWYSNGLQNHWLGVRVSPPVQIYIIVVKLKKIIIESYNEMLYMVSWPKYNELQEKTIIIFIWSLLFSILIAIIDIIFKNFIFLFYNFF